LAVLQRLTRGATGAERAGIRESRVHLPVIVEPPQVLRARDHERDKRRAQRRLAELPIVDTVARLGQRLEIAHQHRPLDELAIVPWFEAEHGARRWDDGRRSAATNGAGGGGGGGGRRGTSSTPLLRGRGPC